MKEREVGIQRNSTEEKKVLGGEKRGRRKAREGRHYTGKSERAQKRGNLRKDK